MQKLPKLQQIQARLPPLVGAVTHDVETTLHPSPATCYLVSLPVQDTATDTDAHHCRPTESAGHQRNVEEISAAGLLASVKKHCARATVYGSTLARAACVESSVCLSTLWLRPTPDLKGNSACVLLHGWLTASVRVCSYTAG